MLKLIRPSSSMERMATEFRSEFFTAGESAINGSELWDRTEKYEDWLKTINENTLSDETFRQWVKTDTFFACDDSGRIVGIIALRYELNDFLKDIGHCGFSVRPTERNKGYATEMLKKILALAYKQGMASLRLSAEYYNVASIRVLEKCGAVKEKDFLHNGIRAISFRIVLP